MTHGSLFSGIGGFDLAAQWMGWENLFHCEWDEWNKKVLNYYWPNAKSYGDITKTDFTIWRGRIDIISGGFPCQPYSLAGKRLGKEDERHLWPEMLRAIRKIQPTWVVGENVLGLVNWDGGLVFNEVQADLEAKGYEVQPYVLPAASVNTPHKRERVWFVAFNSNSPRLQTPRAEQQATRIEQYGELDRIFADTHDEGLERCASKRIQTNERRANGLQDAKFTRMGQQTDWSNFPTQSPICDGDDGLSSRLDGITFPKWRQQSIKAGGNAIVPQVALQIFKAIQEYDKMK